MSKAKSLLDKIKLMFEETPAPAPAPVAPVTVKLADGTDVVVDKYEVGGVMKVGDAFVVAGAQTMENGDVVTVGENGTITAITPKKVEEAPIDMTTPEGITKAYAKFAEGTVDAAGLNIMLKALMEYTFGWQIREQQEKAAREAAIKVYTDGLAGAQATITQQSKMLKEMYSLMEQLVGAPADDVPVDPAKKKFSFSKVEGKNEYFKKMSEAMQKLQEKEKQLKIA